MSKLKENEIEKINDLMASIIQAKEDICTVVSQDCLKCPLNREDKCSELNLKEFDYDEYQWID